MADIDPPQGEGAQRTCSPMPRQSPQAQDAAVGTLVHCAVDQLGGSDEDGIGRGREEECGYVLFGSKLRLDQGQIYNGYVRRGQARNRTKRVQHRTHAFRCKRCERTEMRLRTLFGRPRLEVLPLLRPNLHTQLTALPGSSDHAYVVGINRWNRRNVR